MFTEKDIQQIKSKGITLKQVEAQVSRIKNGMSYSNLIAAQIANLQEIDLSTYQQMRSCNEH